MHHVWYKYSVKISNHYDFLFWITTEKQINTAKNHCFVNFAFIGVFFDFLVWNIIIGIYISKNYLPLKSNLIPKRCTKKNNCINQYIPHCVQNLKHKNLFWKVFNYFDKVRIRVQKQIGTLYACLFCTHQFALIINY